MEKTTLLCSIEMIKTISFKQNKTKMAVRQRISEKAREVILQDKSLRRAIADFLNVDDVCIKPYLKANNKQLLSAGVVDIIAKHSGLSSDEILVSWAGTANLQHA